MALPVLLPRIDDHTSERLTEEARLTEPTRPRPPLATGAQSVHSEDAGRKTTRVPSTARQGRPAPRRFRPDTQVSAARDWEPANATLTDLEINPPKEPMSPHRVRLAKTPRTGPRLEVQNALEALSGMSLHIVYVGQGKEDPPRVVEEPTDKYDCLRHVYDFPAQADAVLLLCYVTFLDAAVRLIKAFKKLSYTPPILPLLLRSDGASFENKQISSISAKLTMAGADDVMVQPRNKLDLPDMLQTTLALVDVHREVENHLLEQIDDRANNLFFIVIDRIIQGFPKLNTTVNEMAASRTNLGGVGRHVFVNVSGEGKFGKVYKTRSASQGSSEEHCEAVKVIPKRTIRTPKHANQVMKECCLMQKVSGHPNVAGFCGLVHARRHLYIFMEFVGNMNLVAVIHAGENRRLVSDRVLELLLQIIDAVTYCHESLVAHRDLKSENVVITPEAIPKLVDFGLAVNISNTEPQELCSDMCGTIPFAPPEVYRGKKFDAQAMDVWSLGIMTLEMRCGNNSVCRLLGCLNMTEPNSELADVFEKFFNVSDWPLLVQNAHGIGMAPELMVVMCKSLVVRPELRWRASDLWQHIANSAGSDRTTRISVSSNRFTGASEDGRFWGGVTEDDRDPGGRATGSDDQWRQTEEQEQLLGEALGAELSLDGDAVPIRRGMQQQQDRVEAPRAKTNFRRLRPSR